MSKPPPDYDRILADLQRVYDQGLTEGDITNFRSPSISGHLRTRFVVRDRQVHIEQWDLETWFNVGVISFPVNALPIFTTSFRVPAAIRSVWRLTEAYTVKMLNQ